MNEQPLPDAIKQALMHGDLSGLTPEQQLLLYQQTCASVGLNPLTNPLQYLELPGQGDKKILKLYATKGCADQLRKVNGISEDILKCEVQSSVYVVTARSSDDSGRHDVDIGAVSIVKEGGEWQRSSTGKSYFKKDGSLIPLQGEDLANAIMRATTKAKRRSTLAFSGLSLLDESEIESIPGAVVREDLTATRQQANASGTPALPPSTAIEAPLASTPREAVPVGNPAGEERVTGSTAGMTHDSKVQPKPTGDEVNDLMGFLTEVYQDDKIVDQHIRAVMGIPAHQSYGPPRLRLTMTGEQYDVLKNQAETAVTSQIIASEEDDVPLTAGPEVSASPQDETPPVDDGPGRSDPPASLTEERSVGAEVVDIESEYRDIIGEDGEFRTLATAVDGYVMDEEMDRLRRWAAEHDQLELLVRMLDGKPQIKEGWYRYCWVQIARAKPAVEA